MYMFFFRILILFGFYVRPPLPSIVCKKANINEWKKKNAKKVKRQSILPIDSSYIAFCYGEVKRGRGGDEERGLIVFQYTIYIRFG